MDFAKDNFAGDLDSAPHNKAAPATGEESAAPSLSGRDNPNAAAPQSPNIGSANDAMNGEVIGPGRADKAPAGKREAEPIRQGSALVVSPRVTRGGDGPKVDPDFSAAGEFSAQRRARLGGAPFFKDDLKTTWRTYFVPAALGLCLFGVGVATGGQYFGSVLPARIGKGTSLAAADPGQTKAIQAEMRRTTQALSNEIHALQARVDTLRPTAGIQSPTDLQNLKQNLDSLKASFESTKAETAASIAQVTAKVERLQREQAKLGKPLEKVGRAERAGAPMAAAGSGAARGTTVALAAALPKGQAQPLGPAPEARHKLRLLTDWVVRDVYEGVALVEGPEGSIEVMRGETIPGVGRVEAIERRPGGWVVVTERGIVASAAGD